MVECFADGSDYVLEVGVRYKLVGGVKKYAYSGCQDEVIHNDNKKGVKSDANIKYGS